MTLFGVYWVSVPIPYYMEKVIDLDLLSIRSFTGWILFDTFHISLFCLLGFVCRSKVAAF